MVFLWRHLLLLFSLAKQVTRDYDEEEQGYDSEKDKKEEKKPAEPGSPKTKECAVERGTGDTLRESKVNGDDHHEEDMDMSDWMLPPWESSCTHASVSFLCDLLMLYLFISDLRCIQLWAINGYKAPDVDTIYIQKLLENDTWVTNSWHGDIWLSNQAVLLFWCRFITGEKLHASTAGMDCFSCMISSE